LNAGLIGPNSQKIFGETPRHAFRSVRRPSFTDEEALAFHAGDKPGKLEIRATKPMATQRDLSLAILPASPFRCAPSAANPDAAY